jgi:hypothetical protein
MFATSRTGQVPATQDDLIGELRALLGGLPVEERARVGRWLADARTAQAMSAEADAAVFELTRSTSYDEVAARLHVSSSAVNKAVTAHRRRTNEQVQT